MNPVRRFWKDEEGLGTLEVILIIVVILVIALIFKEQITILVNNLFDNVNEKTEEFLK
ncbi:Flp1 family type IVb pilin [Paenibacillus sp. JSM ZJ436]